MTGSSSISGVSFKSNYLIPYSEIKKADSATMRQVGMTTVKYATTPDYMIETPNGIAVQVPDSKDKEYEAIIAKYGLNIQKYNGEIKPQGDITERSYSVMVSKIDPENAEKRIDAYKDIKDEKAKSAEYLKVYKEFKNSPYSIEHQQNMSKPKLKPTDKPIIKYTSEDGEKMMAREVELENGYKCIAVANEKNPSEAILMNKEEFKKFFIENAKKLDKKFETTPQIAKGQFADMNFEVECKNGLSKRDLSGKIDDAKFEIKHNNKTFKADEITGNINGKDLNMKMSSGMGKINLQGKLGNDDVDLKITRKLNGYHLKGKFKGKDIDIKINDKLNGFSIEGDNVSLRAKSKSMIGSGIKIQGSYNEDKELIPILLDTAYHMNNEYLEAAILIAML